MAALRPGFPGRDRTNISSDVDRIALHLAVEIGSERNAFRHALFSAALHAEFENLDVKATLISKMEDLKIILDKALQMFIENHDKNDDVLYEILLNQIVDENLATDIFLFFPISMNRLIFRKHSVKFPDCYFQYNEDEQLIGEKKFSANDMYNLIDSFSKEVIHRNLSKENFFAIVKRSSEFNAINNALKDNANLESLKIMPMKIYV